MSAKGARAQARARDAQVGLPARRAAVEVLAAVLQKKQPLDDILGRSLEQGFMLNLPARDRALTRAIVAASLRRKGQIDHVLGTFLERGMPEKSGTLYPILLSAAAQLMFLRTPAHAAIDLAVTLVQYDPKAKRYDKLVNAVLRKVASEGDAIAAALDAARVNTPDWLWSRWVTWWGEERAHAIGAADLVEPPLDVTVKSGRHVRPPCPRPRAGPRHRRALDATPPDLLLLDVMMPEFDGYEVCERVRRRPTWNGTKIIMLTARGRDTERQRGLALGADAYVTKPFSTRELVEQAKLHAARRGLEAGSAAMRRSGRPSAQAGTLARLCWRQRPLAGLPGPRRGRRAAALPHGVPLAVLCVRRLGRHDRAAAPCLERRGS